MKDNPVFEAMSAMNMPAIASLALAAALSTTGAYAQSPRRTPPSRDVFALVSSETDRLLALNVSIGGGYDGNVAAGGEAPFVGTDPRQWPSSAFASCSGDLRYIVRRRRFDFTSFAATALHRYPAVTAEYVTNHAAGAGASVQLGRRTELRLNGAGAFQPFYLLTPFVEISPGDPAAVRSPDLETAVSSGNGLVLTTAADISSNWRRRVRLNGAYEYRSTNYSGTSLDFRSHALGGGISRQIRRHSRLRVGYRYEQGSFGWTGGRPMEIHYIDSGIDYTRPLASMQRTTIAVSMGAALLRSGADRMVRATGNVHLTREIGSTWNADLAYRREFGLVDVLLVPAASDTAAASLGGFLNRRLAFRISALYTNGSVTLAPYDNAFNLYRATAILSASVSRNVAVAAESFYDHYSFASSANLPPGWATDLNRPGVRVQIATWLPLFERARRIHAAR